MIENNIYLKRYYRYENVFSEEKINLYSKNDRSAIRKNGLKLSMELMVLFELTWWKQEYVWFFSPKYEDDTSYFTKNDIG